MRKIAVGMDFSRQSRLAAQQALDIARRTDAEVVLLHAGTVLKQPELRSSKMAALEAHFEEILREQLTERREQLQRMPAELGATDVRVTQVPIEAPPDTGLAGAAEELHADLLVVGTHGRTGLQRFMMGSVAERTVRLAHTSVMVVRKTASAGGFRKILAPVDFSPASDAVVDAAVTMAAPDGAIDVFHIWDVWELPTLTRNLEPIETDSWRGEMREAAQTLGSRLIAPHLGPDGPALRLLQAEGRATNAIQEQLLSDGYDLVVIGSHGRPGLRRFMLGSVAEATARYPPCSVMVVRKTAVL